MALSVDDREQFLAEPHIAALSVAESPERGPLVVPIWYQYTPGGDVWIRTGPNSRKARAIAASGRVSLLVERAAPSVRYVSVEGPVVRTDADTPELAIEMAARYLPADKVDEFIAYEREHLGEHVVIHIRPEHWISADLGAVG